MKSNIIEIKTYDGKQNRSRDPYDTRLQTEVKVDKLYQCMDCGEYMIKKPEEHICEKTVTILDMIKETK